MTEDETQDKADIKITIQEAQSLAQTGPPTKPYWYHYVLCGYCGLENRFKDSTSPSFTLVVGYNSQATALPQAAGLSSSSALVCGSALASMFAAGVVVDKYELAKLCAESERFIGTQGGGMDQAACLLGQAGHALLVDFANPQKAQYQPVALPSEVVFVVTDSCKRMTKATTIEFNQRVAECRLACACLLDSQGLALSDQKPRLIDVQKALGFPSSRQFLESDLLRKSLPDSVELVTLERRLGVEVVSSLLPDNLKASPPKEFRLFKRVKHVLSEARRVEEFAQTANRLDAGDTEGGLLKLAQLMNDSHRSCSEDYQCSCPELDSLVELCLSSGALSSRMTGAGWGGSVVSMLRLADVDAFMSRLPADIAVNSFVVRPSDGATIYSRH